VRMRHFQGRVIAYVEANWIWGDKLNGQIGACGVYCGFCAAFRLEQNRCFGCEWASRLLRKARESKRDVFSGNALKARMLNVVFNAKSFRVRRITTQNTRFTLNKP
jgi:hypothetical protein